MRFRLPLLALLCSVAFSGCGKDSPPPVTHTYQDLASSLDEAKRESAKLLGENGDQARAVWDHVSGSTTWTQAVLTELSLRRARLEDSRDIDDFCPGYEKATAFERDTCWLRIVSAMARYESDFRPAATYVEASGRTSVGLLMMDPDHCPAAPTIEKLKDPTANIQCALTRLELLISRDGTLSGDGNKGAAAYWSVLWAPYTQGSLFLGRKPHIQLFTRSYRAYLPPR
ncbi:MAG: transglycosylase SLT domain-containing protein [Bdellovibrionota bacterium]